MQEESLIAPAGVLRESKCSRACTVMIGVVVIMMLIALAIGAFSRAFYWWDGGSNPIAAHQEYAAIGFAYCWAGLCIGYLIIRISTML
jgi:hypothetical protein